MGKYLVLWEVDWTKVPLNRKERGMGWNGLLALVKKDIEQGTQKDWGSFVGETKGYGIIEASEVEIAIQLQRYVPFVKFEIKAVATVDQVQEVIDDLKK
ncbi:MAG: hypothetical protein JSV62_13975 [Promethearchaeota archaeon]|nr:MAG: hypothetical protein JSV62_13975 [Candidatus Lokiarchaeota archaeon]